jgi:hypothetical protein
MGNIKGGNEKMTREEQNIFLSKEYAEAVRYMDNAKETLRKAGKEDDGFYQDDKYVKSACGIAYLGVLKALDAWFVIKEIPEPPKKKQKSIEYYMSNIARIDKKLVAYMNTTYRILHLEGYYHGMTRVKIINDGFELAYEIIDRIKPENPIEIKESKSNTAKRILNKLMISISVMFG